MTLILANQRFDERRILNSIDSNRPFPAQIPGLIKHLQGIFTDINRLSLSGMQLNMQLRRRQA